MVLVITLFSFSLCGTYTPTTSPSGEVSSMVEDSLQCLQAMASQPVGLGKVLTNGTLEALAKCFTHQHRGIVSRILERV